MLGNSSFPNTNEIESTRNILEEFSSKELCKKKEHQLATFLLHHENGHQYCWGCLSKEIYQKRNEYFFCDTCYGFLKDWLELPLSQGDIFYKLQSKLSFRRFIPSFTKGLLQWIHSIGDLDNEILHSNVKGIFDIIHSNPEYTGIDEELLWSTAMLRGCMTSPFNDDIQYWIDMATECGVVYDAEDTPLWISLWFWRVWNAIPTVHAEHMGWKPASYAGPALGMKPLPIASPQEVNKPNGTNVGPFHSQQALAVPSQQPLFVPLEQEGKEPLLLLPLEEELEFDLAFLDSENTV